MQTLTERTQAGMAAVLSGDARGWRSRLLFAGPAIIASVAYIDPGNYATNIQAGAGYGYRLLWVVVLANLIAMLFQALSARLGDRHRPEPCRDIARPPAPPAGLGDVGHIRSRGDGHRSGRIPRRGQSACRCCSACR